MKKSFSFVLISLFAFTTIHLDAQNCQPNPIYADSTFGIYPLPDLVDSPVSSLNAGCVNSYYEQLFTVAVPDSMTFSFNGSTVDLELISMLIDSIKGLPPYTNYTCEPPSCFFEQSTVGCVLYYGIPVEGGVYEPIIYTSVISHIGTQLTLPINFPGQSSDAIEIFPGQYKIRICSEANCGECTVSTDDVFVSQVSVQQNIPNPFNSTTTIIIDAESSGKFDFKVFDLTGKMIHQKQVMMIAGENIITFDGSQLQSGIYLYAIGQGNNIATNRMIISK